MNKSNFDLILYQGSTMVMGAQNSGIHSTNHASELRNNVHIPTSESRCGNEYMQETPKSESSACSISMSAQC
jgi:hypothetical protein